MTIRAELIRAARAGDTAALDEFLAALLPIAGRMLARLRRATEARTRERIDWEGVQQEVMVHVTKSLPRFRGDHGGQLVAWLHRIVLARHQDALRKSASGTSGAGSLRSLDAVAEVLDFAATDPSPLDHALVEEIRGIVSQVITKLPAQQRLAVRLRCLERRAYCDVAHQLGLSSANAAECLVGSSGFRVGEPAYTGMVRTACRRANRVPFALLGHAVRDAAPDGGARSQHAAGAATLRPRVSRGAAACREAGWKGGVEEGVRVGSPNARP